MKGEVWAFVNHKGLLNSVHSRPKSLVQRLHGTARYSSRKPDQRHKSLVLVNTYTHPGAASTLANLDFLEQLEDEPGDIIVTCGDFNARSGMWDQQGNNPQGKVLEEALGDVIFTPVTTPVPTHPG